MNSNSIEINYGEEEIKKLLLEIVRLRDNLANKKITLKKLLENKEIRGTIDS